MKNSSGEDSAVYLHLQASGHSFNHEDVHIERGVKEVIYVKRERPSRRGLMFTFRGPSYEFFGHLDSDTT